MKYFYRFLYSAILISAFFAGCEKEEELNPEQTINEEKQEEEKQEEPEEEEIVYFKEYDVKQYETVELLSDLTLSQDENQQRYFRDFDDICYR